MKIQIFVTVKIHKYHFEMRIFKVINKIYIRFLNLVISPHFIRSLNFIRSRKIEGI